MKFQSKDYFTPIPLVLLLGYFCGMYYPIVIHYHDWWSYFLVGSAKTYAISFLLGVLGATIQLSIGFAREINNLVLKPEQAVLPTVYEPFGYILKQIWGGVAAVILVLAVKQGFLIAFEKSQGPMDLSAIVVISFVVGLRAYGILRSISGIIKLNPPPSSSKQQKPDSGNPLSGNKQKRTKPSKRAKK